MNMVYKPELIRVHSTNFKRLHDLVTHPFYLKKDKNKNVSTQFLFCQMGLYSNLATPKNIIQKLIFEHWVIVSTFHYPIEKVTQFLQKLNPWYYKQFFGVITDYMSTSIIWKKENSITRKLQIYSDLQVRIETHDLPSSSSIRHVNSTYCSTKKKQCFHFLTCDFANSTTL